MLVPALLLGLAVAAALMSPSTAARVRRVADTEQARDGGDGRPPASMTPRVTPRQSRVACLVGGVAVALLVRPGTGLLVGGLLAVLGPEVFRRYQTPEWRADDEAVARQLPMALDLLAACLNGGATLDSAVLVVAAAAPGVCGHRLARVGAALALGTPAADAWPMLSGPQLPGPAGTPPATATGATARALVRAAESGAKVAAAVSRIAEAARLDSAARASRAARRAGVLAVAPLGLCFLPAFVLIGVVPAVIGLAGPLLSSF